MLVMVIEAGQVVPLVRCDLDGIQFGCQILRPRCARRATIARIFTHPSVGQTAQEDCSLLLSEQSRSDTRLGPPLSLSQVAWQPKCGCPNAGRIASVTARGRLGKL